MFHSARIKLTAWYLAIIMAISLSFSAIIYRSVTLEFQRRLNTIESRFNAAPPVGWRMYGPVHEYFLEDLREARVKVFFMLLYANGIILLLSGAAGYFLAGRTLAPIEYTMEKQKRFVGDASHELKTPLTALQTSVEVALRDKKLSLMDAKTVLKGSLYDIEKLKKLTGDLLTLTSMEQNGNKLTKSRVDAGKIAISAYKKIAPLAKKKKIKIELEAKKIIISSNEKNLEKLITILLDNAVKYTEKDGKVSLSLSLSKSNKYLIIKVKDTGVGISKKDLPHIFGRFYRADTSRTKEIADGYGLGLSIAKSIVDLHNGEIKAESTHGVGSIFTVKLLLS